MSGEVQYPKEILTVFLILPMAHVVVGHTAQLINFVLEMLNIGIGD